MKIKPFKIILLMLTIILLWLTFIYSKYSFFYKNYSTENIDEIFKHIEVQTPVYDSIYIRGYQVYYLTNKRNTFYTKEKEEKPYLVLHHESGLNSSYFIDYFKNKKISNSFHIIAPDRIGFGKTHLVRQEEKKNKIFSQEEKEFGYLYGYISSVIPSEILDKERHYLNELRMVYTGNSSIFAFGNYMNEYLSFNKTSLFYPNFKKRNIVRRYFSKTITNSVISTFFPKYYVNMHKEYIYIDSIKNNHLDSYINFAKNIEYEENNKPYIKKPDPHIKNGISKFIFFNVSSENSKCDIQNLIKSDSSFVIKKIKEKNIHNSPEFILKEILKINDYTKDYKLLELTTANNGYK